MSLYEAPENWDALVRLVKKRKVEHSTDRTWCLHLVFQFLGITDVLKANMLSKTKRGVLEEWCKLTDGPVTLGAIELAHLMQNKTELKRVTHLTLNTLLEGPVGDEYRPFPCLRHVIVDTKVSDTKFGQKLHARLKAFFVALGQLDLISLSISVPDFTMPFVDGTGTCRVKHLWIKRSLTGMELEAFLGRFKCLLTIKIKGIRRGSSTKQGWMAATWMERSAAFQAEELYTECNAVVLYKFPYAWFDTDTACWILRPGWTQLENNQWTRQQIAWTKCE